MLSHLTRILGYLPIDHHHVIAWPNSTTTNNPKKHTPQNKYIAQIFIFGLWNIIKTYQPNPLAGLFFFVTAACAAFAFVSTYLLALYGAAAGGVYGMAKVAESNMRLEGGGGNGRRVIRGGRVDRRGGGAGYRPHYQ